MAAAALIYGSYQLATIISLVYSRFSTGSDAIPVPQWLVLVVSYFLALVPIVLFVLLIGRKIPSMQSAVREPSPLVLNVLMFGLPLLCGIATPWIIEQIAQANGYDYCMTRTEFTRGPWLLPVSTAYYTRADACLVLKGLKKPETPRLGVPLYKPGP